HFVEVAGDKAVQELARVVADDLDHATVGEKRCFHAGNLFGPIIGGLPDGAPKRKALGGRSQGWMTGTAPTYDLVLKGGTVVRRSRLLERRPGSAHPAGAGGQ